MLTARSFYSSFGVIQYNIQVFERLLPRIFINSMENTLEEVTALFNRLKDAKRQAEDLRVEINEINDLIHVVSEREIFKQHLGNLNFDDSTDGNFLIENLEPPKKKFKLNFQVEDKFVVVYTDGACENNGRPNAKAGIGIWFGDNHSLNIARPVQGKATNNVAEIQACSAAIKVAKENGVDNLKICTDSKFTISCMTQWISKWKKNHWKLAGGGDVKNKPELVELDRLCSTLNVKWEHVAGHKGIKGNEEADRLARQGAMHYKN